MMVSGGKIYEWRKILNRNLSNKKIYIAPIAGVTDYSFRRVLKDFGPDLMYTEMVSSNAVTQANKKTCDIMLRLHDIDGVQIFGKDIELMKKTALYVEGLGVKNIDVNMGCPMPKITKNGYGSALLSDPEHARALMFSLKENLKEDTKLSMKIRIGYGEHKNPMYFAKLAEELKLSHITIHGRTREMMYSGTADWEIIKEIKNEVSLPVIGNGDIFTYNDAIKKIKETNVDGIMLARGIFGNPWLVGQIRTALNGGVPEEITAFEKMDTALKHINYVREDREDKEFYFEIRKHLCWYIKGLKEAARFKDLINKTDNYEKLIGIIEQLREININN